MKQKWGQHFLIDDTYVQQMVQIAQIKTGDSVLEIGPGRGILTKALLQQKAQVTAIEIDALLSKKLRVFLHDSNFKLINQDILACSAEELRSLYPDSYTIVANLPYNIASPIFFKLLEIRQSLNSVTIMVQREVAERLCAVPADGKAYGFLSLAADLGFERNLMFLIPPEAFDPPPQVESAVVHFIPKSSSWSSAEELKFLNWAKLLFQQRRKTLLNNIRQHCLTWFRASSSELAESYGNRRSETLSTQEWVQLYERYIHHQGG